MNIIYGSIVTPVYEELLFRGYIWNRFSKVMTSKLHICVWNIALFTIWHFLYIVPNMISGNWDVLQLLKLAAGIGYGTVLGLIRLRTENCWATILAHGIMNFFMI
ncbi:MAG TPA: CPBP family intramembrane metalloprotease [Clostridiaceae bacterium]|nr:CPBP family intramembrane metalloprotease [Clostridiaceae bacterium]